MNTANFVSGETSLHSNPEEALQPQTDPRETYGQGLGRLLPDWMVVRLARWNLPAPLTLALVAVALLGAFMAPRLAASGFRGLLVAGGILAVALVVVLAKWRIVGLAAFPIASLMIPISIGTGSGTGINPAIVLLVILLGLWLLDMLARDRQIRFLNYRPVVAAFVFGVVAIVAFGFGQLPWFATQSASITAQIGGLSVFLLSMGAFLLVAHQVHSLNELKWMVWVFLGVGLVFFTFRLFPVSYPLMARIFSRSAVLGATLYVWLVAMAFSQAMYNKQLAPFWRVLAMVLVLMIFYVNMKGEQRYWISGWLPCLVVVVTIVLLGRPDWGFFAVVAGTIVLLLNTNIITSITEEGDNTYSTITRLEAWRIMAEIIKVNPIFGLGMANYYFYTPLFPILGYRINFNSHNNYIDIIAQTGLVGLLCFVWFLGELWLLGWRLRTWVPEGFPRAYVLGVMGGLAGTVLLAALGDWVIPFVYNIGLEGFRSSIFGFIFLGGLVAVAKLYHYDQSHSHGLQSG